MPKVKPAAKPTRFKKSKRAAIIGCGTLLAGVLSFPLWSTWIAKPIAAKFGVAIDSLEALSWDRWQLQGISTAQPGVEFTAQKAELPSPTKLLFEHFSSDPASEKLILDGWQLQLSSGPKKAEATDAPPLTIAKIVELTDNSLVQLGSYLSRVELNEGRVSLEGKDTLELSQITLSPQSLAARLKYSPRSLEATLEVAFAAPGDWKIAADVPQYELALATRLLASESDTSLRGTLTSFQNPIQIEATWQSTLLPSSAKLSTKAFALDQRYAFWSTAPALQVDASANWSGQAFDYSIEGFDTSAPTKAAAIQLAGTGSQTALQIDTAKVDLPWLSVESDKPILLDFTLDNPLEAATLEAKLDLAKVPFLEASGKLNAHLKTKTSAQGLPIIIAELHGAKVTLWDSVLETVSANVELLGQSASIKSLDLKTAAGSSLSLDGEIDIEEKRLSNTHLSLQLENESQRLRELLPNIDWQTALGELELTGPIATPEIGGQLSFKSLKLPSASSFSLETEIAGTPQALQANIQAVNETETLALALHIDRTPAGTSIDLQQLALSANDGSPILALEERGTLSVDTASASISSSGIVLSGPAGQQFELSSLLISDTRFELHATAIDFETDIFNAWLEKPIPSLRILDFDTQATLSETDSQITTSGSASWALKETSSVDISWLAKSDPDREDSLSIDHLEVGADSKHILLAEGHFPVSVNWSHGTPISQIHQDAPLEFSLQSSPHPDFWKSIETILPIALKRPVINAQLSGTLNDPKGKFDLKLASVNWKHPSDSSKNIQLQDISASLLADSEGLAIRALEAHAGKNSIYADAALPLGKTSLINLLQNTQLLDFSPLSGHARAELRELEALKAWLPPIMRYDGQALIDFDLAAGDITATAKIENLATRPFPPLGALSKISGQIDLKNGVWKIQQLQGIAEKSPFSLSGLADLNDPSKPTYDLTFTSKEFPLVRADGLMLSGDIDLQLVSKNLESPLLRGKVKLTKGLFLIEPDLLASSTKTVGARPPYFSVEQEPFDEWNLDIEIRGDQFLRASNSYFQGTLSADFNLEGSLGAPLLIGKAETYEGRIFFPASSLKLKTGQAFITRERPSELQIEALAEGRLFAYDINLEVRGTADNPEMIINSNPALTQVEALLLLTTGAIPNDGGNLAQQSATSLGVFIGKGLFKKLTGGNGDSASKLNLEVGQDISQQGKKTIEASYQLSEDLELEGEYDKRDEFNANLKWTIFKR